MDSRFRSRKFIVAMLLFGTATALLVGGYVDEGTWKDVVILVGGAYLTADVIQNIGTRKK